MIKFDGPAGLALFKANLDPLFSKSVGYTVFPEGDMRG
jgi:hypothetical protein